MKKIFSVNLFPSPEDRSTFVYEHNEIMETRVWPTEDEPTEPFDWRTAAKEYASYHGLRLLDGDLETVKTFFEFLYRNRRTGSFRIMDNKDFAIGVLPEDTVYLGHPQFPHIAFWEGEWTHPACSSCCEFNRKKCPGKGEYIVNTISRRPLCFEECLDHCPYDPTECSNTLDYPPDDTILEGKEAAWSDYKAAKKEFSDEIEAFQADLAERYFGKPVIPSEQK